MARKIDLPPNIVVAGYGKRFFAYLIDLILIALGIAVMFVTIGMNVILPSTGFNETVQAKDDFLTSTRITDTRDTTWGKLEFPVKEGEKYGYEIYAERIWTFTTQFLPAHTELTMDVSGFSLSKEGVSYTNFVGDRTNPRHVGYWAFKNFFEPTTFYKAVDGEDGQPDYTKQPELTNFAQGSIPASTLITGFHNKASGTGSYDDLYNYLFLQNYVRKFDTDMSKKQWVSYLPGVIASPLIFNFIIPMFFPKGKSFGKLVLGLQIADETGIEPKKGQLAIRYGIVTAVYAILIIRNFWISMIGTQIAMMLLFITVALSGTTQGIHDIIARTIVVDERKSRIFKTKEELEEYAQNHPDTPIGQWKQEKTADQFMEEYGDRMDD